MPKPKNKEPQTYSSVLKSIQDMGGKKKASALLPAMRSMTKYLHKGNSELLDATVNLLPSIRVGKEDVKVVNLIHLFCSQLANTCTVEENTGYANVLESELDHSYFARALSAFKAYCVVLKHANMNDKLKETVLRFANGAKNGETMMAQCLSELFCVLRYCDLDCSEMDSLINWGMTTSDPSVIRHCLGMMLSFADKNPARVAPMFQAAMQNADVTASIMNDSLSATTYVRLCWCLYQSNKDSAFLKTLCSIAQQPSEASSLLAMEFLCNLSFEELNAFNLNGDAGNGELIQFIADSLKQRCVAFAEANDNLGLIAICRIVILLSKCLMTHFNSRIEIAGTPAMDAVQQSLNVINETLSSFSNNASIYLQNSILKVKIWMVNPPKDEDAVKEYRELVRSTKAMKLPTGIAREILQQIVNRGLSTPSLSHFAVEVAWAWFLENPMTVTVDALIGCWHACFSLHDVSNTEYVLNAVFRFLDYSTPREEFHNHIATLKTAAYWFLGDCVDLFANSQETTDCSHLFQAILLRLQKAAVLGDWKTRREAVRSLGKIGIVSDDPIRICVYEMLQNLTKAVSSEEAVVFNDLIEPILDVFDQIYETLELDKDPAPIIEKERVLFHQRVIN